MMRRAASLAALLVLAVVAAPAARAATIDAPFGYANGTILHADVLRSASSRLVDAEVSSSSAATQGAPSNAQILNEVGQVVKPAGVSVHNYGVATGLSAGLATASDATNQVQLIGRAEALSKAGSLVANKTLGPVSLNPLVYAAALNGDAQVATDSCALGNDLSNGQSYVADAQVLNAGGTLPGGKFAGAVVGIDAPKPERSTVWTMSRTRLVPQTDASDHVLGHDLGLMSETRETILPVTLLRGMAQQTTIEVLGEWVLRAVATGEPGGAYVQFGPEGATDTTPVLRIIQASGTNTVLTLQQILGAKGFNLPIPGVGTLSIGELARKIGGDYGTTPDVSTDGTLAAAAADVVRVKLLPSSGLADVRIGHMEVHAEVPTGGVTCQIPVTKTSVPETVGVGDTFKTPISINNIFNCDLTVASATDSISANKAAEYSVGDVTDGGAYSGNSTAGQVGWTLGKILAGKTKDETVNFTATAGPGEITDTVTVLGTCPLTTVSGHTTVTVNVTGSTTTTTTVSGTKVLGKQFHRPLPTTGLNDADMATYGALFLLVAVLVRRRLSAVPF